MAYDPLFDNADFLADLDNTDELSNRVVAERWGKSKTFVQKYRSNPELIERRTDVEPTQNETSSENSDGDIQVEKLLLRKATIADAEELVISQGKNPDDYHFAVKARVTKNGYMNQISAWAKHKKGGEPTIDWSSAGKLIEDFIYIPSKLEYLTETAVLQPTDYQIGKTDFGGGSESTVESAMNSFAAFADRVHEYRPRTAVFANTGDIIENFCNTSSQRDTNDLDLPHQVLHAYKLELAGIKMIAPLVGELKYATVPSNHGRWRVGLKDDGGDPHADWGIVIAKQVAETLDFSGRFDNVSVHIPDRLMESMTLQAGNSKIGLVHGHQISKPDLAGEWWAKQDHGRMPTWDADLLLVGHYHSFRTFQSGDKRWVIVGSTTEPGSSWYGNLKGESSVRGMVTFLLDNGKWSHLEII